MTYTIVAYRPSHTWYCGRGCCYEGSDSEMIIEELETEEQTIEAAARRKFANEIRDKTMGEWEVTVLIDGKTYVDTDDYPDPHTKIDSAVFLRSNELLAAGLPAEGLMGGTNPDDLKRIIENFRATRGRIVCTIDFAQAFSLTPAEECYFIGYDWDPNDNRQAEDRLVPQQGVNPITSNYYSFLDTVDDFVAERVNIKSDNLNVTLKSFGT